MPPEKSEDDAGIEVKSTATAPEGTRGLSSGQAKSRKETGTSGSKGCRKRDDGAGAKVGGRKTGRRRRKRAAL